MAVIRGFVRTVPDGAPVPDGTPVELRAELDNEFLAQTTTVGGMYEFARDGTYPPYRVIAVHDDITKITSSLVTGMTGPTTLSTLPYMFRSWSDGIIEDVFGELSVSANAVNMNMTVASGAAHVHGIIYDQLGDRTLTLAPADPVNPRIDTIAVEVAPAGSGMAIEGRSDLVVVQGQTAAEPVPPALTQGAAVWQMPLADVRVDAGVTAIATNKVVDRRVPSAPYIPDGTITPPKFHGDVAEWIRDLMVAFLKAGENITITHDDEKNELTISSSGGSSASLTATYNDANFIRNANVGSQVNLGTATIKLPPGKHLISSQVHLSARNASGGSGYVRIKLAGTGAPEGIDQSSRGFRVSGTSSRQILLTGRRIVEATKETTYTAVAQAVHESGSQAFIEDGVCFMRVG